MRIVRQFLVLIALSCAAAFCAVAGSAFAHWITVPDHRPVAIGEAAQPTGEGPDCEMVEQHQGALVEGSVHDREPVVDLYGNDVTDAVASYMFDSTGALFEEHSPKTEVARLAAPES